MFFEVEENLKLKPCPICGGEPYVRGMFLPTECGEINAYAIGCSVCKKSFHQNWDFDEIVDEWNKWSGDQK